MNCEQIERTSFYMIVTLVTLLLQLWLSSFVSKMYSERIQDRMNDLNDKELVNFVWNRRRETWVQVEGCTSHTVVDYHVSNPSHLARHADAFASSHHAVWPHSQLERFEDVVQRQFEELRVSLVHRLCSRAHAWPLHHMSARTNPIPPHPTPSHPIPPHPTGKRRGSTLREGPCRPSHLRWEQSECTRLPGSGVPSPPPRSPVGLAQ